MHSSISDERRSLLRSAMKHCDTFLSQTPSSVNVIRNIRGPLLVLLCASIRSIFVSFLIDTVAFSLLLYIRNHLNHFLIWNELCDIKIIIDFCLWFALSCILLITRILIV